MHRTHESHGPVRLKPVRVTRGWELHAIGEDVPPVRLGSRLLLLLIILMTFRRYDLAADPTLNPLRIGARLRGKIGDFYSWLAGYPIEVASITRYANAVNAATLPLLELLGLSSDLLTPGDYGWQLRLDVEIILDDYPDLPPAIGATLRPPDEPEPGVPRPDGVKRTRHKETLADLVAWYVGDDGLLRAQASKNGAAVRGVARLA